MAQAVEADLRPAVQDTPMDPSKFWPGPCYRKFRAKSAGRCIVIYCKSGDLPVFTWVDGLKVSYENYVGRKQFWPLLGEPNRPLESGHIRKYFVYESGYRGYLDLIEEDAQAEIVRFESTEDTHHRWPTGGLEPDPKSTTVYTLMSYLSKEQVADFEQRFPECLGPHWWKDRKPECWPGA